MADSFTETTSQGWLSRLMESIKSVLVGLVLFVLAFPLLFWNEGRAVRTAQSLEEGAGVVVSVAAATVEPGNEGRLVHLSGEATTTETLADPEFGVRANAIKLTRNVAMYQWKEEKKSETKKKVGGGEETVTTYTYKKDWSDRPVDSSDFKEPAGHTNPTSFPVEEKSQVASKVTLGGFTLSDPVVQRLDQHTDVPVDPSTLPPGMKGRVAASGAGYYMGANPQSPQVGDVRIAFKAVKPATVSLVARQVRDTFEAYPAKAGDQILLLKYGTLSADAMFKAAQAENATLTWILRFVGFLIMFFGILMVFRPLVVFADVIPLFGTLLGAGIGVFAGLGAAVLSLVTIAVSWIFFRPLLGIALLVLAAGGIAALVMVGLKKKQARVAVPTKQRGVA
jgi:Transmembrane protein 43